MSYAPAAKCLASITFTTSFYLYKQDSPSILSTNVSYNTSSVSRSIVTYVNKGQTSICTVWHRLGKVGTIYLSNIMCIHGRQMCAQTFVQQKKCSSFGTVITVFCVLLLKWCEPFYWLLIFVQNCEVDNLTTGAGKNLSWSNPIIVVKICAVITKHVSDTKMCYFDNCERSEKCGGLWAEECIKKEYGTLLVLQSCCFVQRHGRWYTRCWALFEKECSISRDEMNMIWTTGKFWFQTWGVALVTGAQM
jgi:hypothetical protein